MKTAKNRIESYQMATAQLEAMQIAIDKDDRQAFMEALDSYSPKDAMMLTADDALARNYINLMEQALRKWLLVWQGFDKKIRR